jgi:hypothetical protein
MQKKEFSFGILFAYSYLCIQVLAMDLSGGAGMTLVE